MPAIDRLADELRKLSNQVEHETMPTTLDEASDEILAEVKADAPVRTGTLRDSLMTERDGLVVSIGPDASAMSPKGELAEVYGQAVEFDEPFLRPAIDNAEPKVERALKQKLSKL